MEILNALKPTSSLEILKVGGCRWNSFPDWVFLPHLKVIHVYCFWIERLFAFGELPFLEVLSFDDLPLIKMIDEEFYGHSDVTFPSLRELTFSQMPSWSSWVDASQGKRSMFPKLKKLRLSRCSVLETLPIGCFPSSVVEFILLGCHRLGNIETVLKGMPSLSHLSISAGQRLESFDLSDPLHSLEAMHRKGIKEFLFGGSESLINLRKLELINMNMTYQKECKEIRFPALTYLHVGHSNSWFLLGLGKLPSLRTLLITEDHGTGIEYTRYYEFKSWFNQLTSLIKLEFRDCFMMRCLPQLHMLTSLKILHINYCPKMLSLPENGLPQNLAELYINKCPRLIRR